MTRFERVGIAFVLALVMGCIAYVATPGTMTRYPNVGAALFLIVVTTLGVGVGYAVGLASRKDIDERVHYKR
jgi:hypothetical protein